MVVSNRYLLFRWFVFRAYVSFREGMHLFLQYFLHMAALQSRCTLFFFYSPKQILPKKPLRSLWKMLTLGIWNYIYIVEMFLYSSIALYNLNLIFKSLRGWKIQQGHWDQIDGGKKLFHTFCYVCGRCVAENA